MQFRTVPFINGSFVSTVDESTIESVNPATGKSLVTIQACGAVDVDYAVSAARRAFDDGRWRKRSPAERKTVLFLLADLIDRHTKELGLLETLEMGMPITYSAGLFIPKAANMVRWYAEAIDKMYGEVAPTPYESLAIITREPIGVVAAIIPWNIPLYLAAYKLGPALASGNSVVLKPSERSTLSALRLAELASEAGLPDGVLNVVTGLGTVAGRALGCHPDVDCLTFTGSSTVGKQYLHYAAESNMKRVFLEGGGKSANIVFEDVADWDEAVKQAALGAFFNQGEICSAGSRLLVQSSIKEQFVTHLCEVARLAQLGDPQKESTAIGPLVSRDHMQRVLSYVESGEQDGARLRCGGKAALGESGGFFMEPTVFDGVDNRMRIAQEEIFGPVLSVIAFNTPSEAVAIANDSIYGLGAAVWSSDINLALSTARELRAGQVWVNNYDESDITVPWGGFRQSGNGRDKSLHAFEQYSELKATWIRVGAAG